VSNKNNIISSSWSACLNTCSLTMPGYSRAHNKNNNVCLFNWRHNMQSTSATQGRCWLHVIYYIQKGLTRLNCCHTQHTAVDNHTGLTSWTLTRWRTSTHPIKLLTAQFIDPERIKGWVGQVDSACSRYMSSKGLRTCQKIIFKGHLPLLQNVRDKVVVRG